MLRIAVCDDMPEHARAVSAIAENWARTRGIDARVCEYSSAGELLMQISPDIALIDIGMPGIDGLTLARKLRARDERLQIVFITSYIQYMSEGYDVSALHYLIKPVSEDKLREVLDRARAAADRDARAVTITEDGEIIRVALSSIVYIQAALNYAEIIAQNRAYRARVTLAALETQLDARFFRCGRSLIVNLARVRRVARREIEMTDGAILPLPRGAYDALNRGITRLE